MAKKPETTKADVDIDTAATEQVAAAQPIDSASDLLKPVFAAIAEIADPGARGMAERSAFQVQAILEGNQ